MKSILCTIYILSIWVQTAYPCSSFVLKNGKTVLLGKNFDWTLDQGLILKNVRNTHKVAYYTHDGTPASWTSKYGSITFNQNGKEMPYGGMNEKGLVVEMLWMDETQFNISEDKAYLNELEWIQYQLDNFHSIDEVIANIESFKVYPIQGKIHYLLADTHGKSVIIEYVDKKPKIYLKGTNSCQAITNKPVEYSEKYIDNSKGIPKKNTSTTYRYHILEKQIRKLLAPDDFSETTAFKMLKNVSIPDGVFKTVWSVVYNLEYKTISFSSYSHKKIKQIDLNKIDFEQKISYFNINQDQETTLDTKLMPLTEKENREIATASLMHLGFDKQLSNEISQHQFNQNWIKKSYFSQNYFHFDISIPLFEAGKRLVFVVMDTEDNFNKKVAVTGGYIIGTTAIGTVNRHIYGLKNGTYSMIALIDENRNSELDFDNNKKPIEKYAMFSEFIPKSMVEITFKNSSNYFAKENAKLTIEWR